MQRPWTRRACGTAAGLKVPPVIALCLRRNTDLCPTRTVTFRPGTWRVIYLSNDEIKERERERERERKNTECSVFTDNFRFSSRSATATPTGSPKKRQLPLIPAALKERAAQDLEERARFIRHRNRQVHTTYRSTGIGGESLLFPLDFACREPGCGWEEEGGRSY